MPARPLLLALLLLACTPKITIEDTTAPTIVVNNPPDIIIKSGEDSAPDNDLSLLSAAEGNLILNPGAEDPETPAKPAHWSADSWGENENNISWASSTPFSGNKYLAVTVSNYTSGDAKWVFDAQKLKPDTWYEYSSYYRSDGRSRLIKGCTSDDGKRSFQTIWQSHASASWKRMRVRFYVSSTDSCHTTLMHVVDRNGYLHSDHHQLIEVEAQPLKSPRVSISFDDIYTSAVDVGATALEKYGWKGSYYVTGRYARLNDAPEYANEAKVKGLIARGHEVGSHAETHPALSSLDPSSLNSEIKNNLDYLKLLGQHPAGMAYPFGDFSQSVEDEVKRFHDYARTSLVGLNDSSADPYRLRILPITNTTSTLSILNWIDDAERSSTWLILLFHDLADNGDATYTTGIAQYEQVLTYLSERPQIEVVTVEEGLAKLRSE